MVVPRRSKTLVIGTLALATLGVWCSYGAADTGFYYDDYHFVRPPFSTELHRVWFGPWDVTGIEVEFFRPLTALMFHARFWLFGVNAEVLHLLSLAGHVVCAVLVAAFAFRGGMSRRGSATTGLLYAIYPTFPYSQVSWLTNQMHLAESLLVLVGLLVWQSATANRRWPWLAVGVLGCLAFLVKEDGLMLVVAVAALTMGGLGPGRDLAARTRLLVLLAAVGVVAVLVWFRQDRLGVVGGYGVPGVLQGLFNWVRGLENALFLWPTRRPWQGLTAVCGLVAAAWVAWQSYAASRRMGTALALMTGLWLATYVPYALQPRAESPLLAPQGVSGGFWLAVLIAGLWAVLRCRQPGLTTTLVTGATIVFCFNAPFVLVTKREQLHLVSLGAVLVGSSCLEGLLILGRARWRGAIAATVALSVPLVLLSRTLAHEFVACAPAVLAGDEAATGWWVVPDEVKTFLRDKPRECASGALRPLSHLDQIWWGTFEAGGPGEDTPGRWTMDRATALVRSTAHRVTLDVRAPRETLLVVDANGTSTSVNLPAGRWTTLGVDLVPDLHVALRRSHRVDLSVAQWFVPADRGVAYNDFRRHGIQLGRIRVE